MGERNTPAIYPGRHQPPSAVRSPSARATPAPYDPNEDDPLEHVGGTSVRSGSSDHHSHNNHNGTSNSQYIIAPSIQVKPEFSTLTRTTDPTQPLTCIVTIELPSRRTHAHVPGPVMDPAYRAHQQMANSVPAPSPSPRPDHHASQNLSDRSDVTVTSRHRPGSPDSLASTPYVFNPTPASQADSPFNSITEDLRNRIIDWKGHPLSGLGQLQMFDLLSVRRDSLVREFYVYLFREAIICVIEEKKRGLGRLLSSAGASSAFGDNPPVAAQTKGVLRLKGRIYIRHIKQVTETSVAGELSLTIDMEDERLESFILIFKDRSSLETWRAHIADLVAGFHGPRAIANTDEFGVPPSSAGGKAQRMLSGSTGSSDAPSQSDSLLAQGSSRSTMSSTSNGSRLQNQGKHHAQHDEYPSQHSHSPGLIAPHMSSGPSNSLPALPHTPLDLILVLSLPPPSASPSTAGLKHRVIKTALDFVVASLGPKDRLSLVTFEVGLGGHVRKTPFLCTGRAQGHLRLAKFVEGIGARDDGAEDEFVVRTAKEEKTDVVTAVNHGLDVVLQRKSRNAISGMMLVSDAADSTRRAQMDLVLARAEAAK